MFEAASFSFPSSMMLAAVSTVPTSHTDQAWFRSTESIMMSELDQLEAEEEAYENWLKMKREAPAPPPMGTILDSQRQEQEHRFADDHDDGDEEETHLEDEVLDRTSDARVDSTLDDSDEVDVSGRPDFSGAQFSLSADDEEGAELSSSMDRGFHDEGSVTMRYHGRETPSRQAAASSYERAREAAAIAASMSGSGTPGVNGRAEEGSFETPPYYGSATSLMGGQQTSSRDGGPSFRSGPAPSTSPHPVRRLNSTPDSYEGADDNGERAPESFMLHSNGSHIWENSMGGGHPNASYLGRMFRGGSHPSGGFESTPSPIASSSMVSHTGYYTEAAAAASRFASASSPSRGGFDETSPYFTGPSGHGMSGNPPSHKAQRGGGRPRPSWHDSPVDSSHTQTPSNMNMDDTMDDDSGMNFTNNESYTSSRR